MLPDELPLLDDEEDDVVLPLFPPVLLELLELLEGRMTPEELLDDEELLELEDEEELDEDELLELDELLTSPPPPQAARASVNKHVLDSLNKFDCWLVIVIPHRLVNK